MTESFISSLYKTYQEIFRTNNMELLIIDNNSQDGAADYLTNVIKHLDLVNVHVIKNKTNDGFAKACNLGMKHANGEFILFLNNDSLIKSTGFLDMVTFMKQHTDVAIMGGKLRNSNGSPQLSACKFYTLGNALLMLLGLERLGLFQISPRTINQVDWVTGGCMMIDKKIFNDLQGFDEHFFMYMEDMELCYRAVKHGYKVYYYPYLDIRHFGQGSSNRSFAIINIYKGMLYFYQKHMPHWQYMIIRTILIIKAKLLVIFGKISKRVYLTNTYGQALKIF